MRSMTGYGKARLACATGWITAEIESVNRRQLEVIVSVPKDWASLEAELRDLVMPAASRGRVQLSVGLQSRGGGQSPARFDPDAARRFIEAFDQVRREFKLGGELAARDVLAAPGVFSVTSGFDPAQESKPILEVVSAAVADWTKMRDREGRHLCSDFKKRLAALRKARERIRKRVPAVQENHRAALLARVAAANIPCDPGDEAFRRELFLFADRSDISEELARIESHLNQFALFLDEATGAGRKIEFLLQELQREVNTIGSKACDADISHVVVDMKTEIEKAREQVQNIE